MSLLSRLQQIPDPRSRRRREYPLHGLLAILILAAAHGGNYLPASTGDWKSPCLDKLDVALNAAARLPAQRSAFGLSTSQSASADFLC